MSEELAVRVDTIVEEPNDFTVVASSPAEMQRAQHSLILWAARKIQAEKQLWKEADEQIQIALKNKWAIKAWQKRLNMSTEKIEFYKKIKGALEAGYYIVPPFPLEIFAVRTNRKAPKWQTSEDKHIPARAEMLPAGKGRYVAGNVGVGVNTEYARKPDGSRDYNTIVHQWFQAAEYRNVDFPFKLAKTEIMESTSSAFALKIFDQFGILPKMPVGPVVVKRDPIICGQILAPHKKREPITFFVSWWLDTRTL